MWIKVQGDYHEPDDPFHCSLYVTEQQDVPYDEPWQQCKEGTLEILRSTEIYVRPEGVAADGTLNPEQLSWFRMGPESTPHISLLVAKDHLPKQLGPMVKRARAITKWYPTDNLLLHRRRWIETRLETPRSSAGWVQRDYMTGRQS